MARPLRACRAEDGLTLQQLATRCGVAASTIHKIEAQQMVPTVSVVLKIARGLGRRPEELVRDGLSDTADSDFSGRTDENHASDPAPFVDRGLGAWRFDYTRGEWLDRFPLEPGQRATMLLERGRGEVTSQT